MKSKSHSTAFFGLCCALALVLAYVEVLMQPLFPALPGIKMGLPNVIIIFLLYRRGAVSAAGVSLLRILLAGLLFGNAMSLAYSLTGGILSLAVMVVLKKLGFMSEIGVSVAGGVVHNAGQILMAMLLLETAELGYYLIVLIVTGTVAGLFVGILGAILNKRLPQKLL